MAAAKKVAAPKAALKAEAKTVAPAPVVEAPIPAPAPVVEAPAPAPAPVVEAPVPAPAPVVEAPVPAVAAEAAQPGDRGDQDMAETETIKPADGEAFVLVRKGLERFHRCGMRFTREPMVLVLADLDEGVLDRLKAEPNLVVVEG